MLALSPHILAASMGGPLRFTTFVWDGAGKGRLGFAIFVEGNGGVSPPLQSFGGSGVEAVSGLTFQGTVNNSV